MKEAVIGIVGTRSEAEVLIRRLEAAGFSHDEISALVPEPNGHAPSAFVGQQHTRAPHDPAKGTQTDKAIGSGLAVLAGLGALAIPGIGLFLGAGPIVAALSGLAMGAMFVGGTSLLVKAGVSEYDAKKYEELLRAGKILVFVHTSDGTSKKRAEDVLSTLGVPCAFSQTEGKSSRHDHAH